MDCEGGVESMVAGGGRGACVWRGRRQACVLWGWTAFVMMRWPWSLLVGRVLWYVRVRRMIKYGMGLPVYESDAWLSQSCGLAAKVRARAGTTDSRAHSRIEV